MNLAGPLGTPLGLSQWKRASSRVEAGTSGFLSNSDSDRSVPAELGQESQAMSFLRNGTPLASRVVHGVSGPLSNCVWNLQVFPDDVLSSIRDSRKSWRCALVTEGKRDPTKACVQDLMFMSRGDRNLGVAFQTHPGVRPRLEGKQRTLLSSRVGRVCLGAH